MSNSVSNVANTAWDLVTNNRVAQFVKENPGTSLKAAAIATGIVATAAYYVYPAVAAAVSNAFALETTQPGNWYKLWMDASTVPTRLGNVVNAISNNFVVKAISNNRVVAGVTAGVVALSALSAKYGSDLKERVTA